jgi:hypothetical protein
MANQNTTKSALARHGGDYALNQRFTRTRRTARHLFRERGVGFQKDGTLVFQNLSPLSCSLACARV